jgi:hypothetical protein
VRSGERGLADINADGAAGAFEIELFIELLLGE